MAEESVPVREEMALPGAPVTEERRLPGAPVTEERMLPAPPVMEAPRPVSVDWAAARPAKAAAMMV